MIELEDVGPKKMVTREGGWRDGRGGKSNLGVTPGGGSADYPCRVEPLRERSSSF